MKNTQNEQWLEIENSGGIYQISNTGRILSFRGKTARYLKPQVNNYGHKIVFLKFSNDFSAHTMVLSRLVAKAFVRIRITISISVSRMATSSTAMLKIWNGFGQRMG